MRISAALVGADGGTKTPVKDQKITTGTLDKGSAVDVKWKDGNWYLALVTEVKHGTYKIMYTDKSKAIVGKSQLCPITKELKGKEGYTVYAFWKRGERSGQFYKGMIESIDATGPAIIWDDGAPTKQVPWDQVIKPE